MALTDPQRQDARDRIMRERDPIWTDVAATKAELRQLIDALDDFLETNALVINAAIPAGIRSKFTPAQKTLGLAIVALGRAGR